MKLILALFLLFPTMVSAASPVPEGTISSVPGWRMDPFGSGKMEYHRGYDITCPIGTPVRPMQAGTVSYVGPHKGHGNLVAVDHGNGYVTMYAHLSRILIQLGSKVTTDTVIALSGNTGHSMGPHLHLEYRVWPGVAFAHKDQQIPNEQQAHPEETWVDYQLVSAKSHADEEKLLPGGWRSGM